MIVEFLFATKKPRSEIQFSTSEFDSVTTANDFPVSTCSLVRRHAFAATEVSPLRLITRLPFSISLFNFSNSSAINAPIRRKRLTGVSPDARYSCGELYFDTLVSSPHVSKGIIAVVATGYYNYSFASGPYLRAGYRQKNMHIPQFEEIIEPNDQT